MSVKGNPGLKKKAASGAKRTPKRKHQVTREHISEEEGKASKARKTKQARRPNIHVETRTRSITSLSLGILRHRPSRKEDDGSKRNEK